MKKIVSLVIVCVILFAFCACGSGSSSSGSSSKEVELTADNIEEYFKFDTSYDNYEVKTTPVLGVSITITYCDIVLNAYQTVSGQLSNAKVKIEVSCPGSFHLDESDTALRDAPTSKIIDISFPADGKYSTTIPIGALLKVSEPSSPCSITVLEASGTIIVD